MARKTINQLTELTEVNGSDKLAIYDNSTNTTKKTSVDNLFKLLEIIGFSSHNVSRNEPKDITSYFTDGTIWKRLNGTDGFTLFEDIYIGDYWQMSRAISAPNQDSQYEETGTQWCTIAGFDTLMGNGDSYPEGDNDALNPVSGKHHMVIIPGKGFTTEKNHFGKKRMNGESTTVGGYVNSGMHTATLGSAVSSGSTATGATINQQLYAEFGTHLKTTRELLSSAINSSGYNRLGSNSGCSSNWAWTNSQAVLMSEVEVYGSIVWSSSGYDTGTAKNQLPIFRNTCVINNKSAVYWLKDIASSGYFCIVANGGHADTYRANNTNVAVRPRFVLGA